MKRAKIRYVKLERYECLNMRIQAPLAGFVGQDAYESELTWTRGGNLNNGEFIITSVSESSIIIGRFRGDIKLQNFIFTVTRAREEPARRVSCPNKILRARGSICIQKEIEISIPRPDVSVNPFTVPSLRFHRNAPSAVVSAPARVRNS